MSDFFGMDEMPDSKPPAAPTPQTVSQLLHNLRQFVEAHFHDIWIEGEISDWSMAASGHCYFSLRDQSSLVNCVMWRKTAQRVMKNGAQFQPGDMVEASGRLSVYEPRGQVQLVINNLKPVGAGLLYQKFLELKSRLESEGLFDTAKKKQIPALPRKIGIVTSPTGAAIRDVLSVLQRRAPGIEVMIWPTRVQGNGAANELREGVRKLAQTGEPEVIILTRGGGSLEDLWQFNDEQLAREIARCPVPVISAVGHEVDFSISDFVADLRAPTPSAAAEIVSENHGAVRDRVLELMPRLERVVFRSLQEKRNHVHQLLNSYSFQSPIHRLETMIQRADDLTARLEAGIDDRIYDLKQKTEKNMSALAGHNPDLILQKGYAITRDASSKKVITSAEGAKRSEELSLQFHDGEINATRRQN